MDREQLIDPSKVIHRPPEMIREHKSKPEPMSKSWLIEELKKIDGVLCDSRFFGRFGSNNRIMYFVHNGQLLITTDYDHEWEDENTIGIDNLEPATILDLFRKWR